DYLYEVGYDPDLTDAPAALATALRPSYPNPFRPILHQQTRLIFDLTTPSVETRVAIFSPTGDLVWQQVLGARAAREGHAVAWDGRNLAGKLVGTGVYHVLLETDGQRLTRSLAVVRE
ncbi:MAG: FlgD immunoglobulin-like domain containing protein, partial [Candidatus Latescibacteria bacterium]|nr:FlgD immunoglobulin-like domain containing protein [Candidatus Latescibacterota bacterium]